mmetsp:Transcript_11904/g.17966  ORF Transcript_11904/g.17966 Transcript_11904/m.17966 type:complete len:451 (+) Transcript_11904:46-1398(+)|eukprot:CAMPEP_0202705320 /NCGR_PEP_ID=MMETSP1385-20130828/17882_1 /ASSEMBLY_ACC=CAM_ASM_000861 /TAXON_ID=933848 /ORGANISM="Elphidium margaritaceum" /LENGTH=450 /DNA_ID=CAMNT_0049363525 /DNA_START=20 /DNA_END=1372 /DNA_ORIENTATION=-
MTSSARHSLSFDSSPDTSKTRTPRRSQKKSPLPINILQRLPLSFSSSLHLQLIEEKDNIDGIEEQCDTKVLVIEMARNIMSEYTPLSDFLANDADFQHYALPRTKVIDVAPSQLQKSSNKNNDSSSASSQLDNYVALAKLIDQFYYEYDGFVIVEKVSKLAYAASYLSFMLENLCKAVVFTSSTNKLDAAFNDAKMNLISSLIIAGRSGINEVTVCFDRTVYRGNRTIRHDQASHAAFESPNMKALAQFGTALIINKSMLLPVPKRGFKVFTRMFSDIIVLYLTPCTSFALLRYLLCCDGHGNDKNKGRGSSQEQKAPRSRGVVISLYGAGNAPQSPALKQILVDSIDVYGCNIVITTQCTKGHVNMSVYAAGNYFHGVGLINGHDMTIEACVAKLAYLMGKGLKGSELRHRFAQDMNGELTPMHLIKGRIVDYKRNKGDHHGVNNVFGK